MISYIALTLSIINSLLWIVFAIGVRKLFKQLYPVFKSFGIMQSQNLQNSPVFDIIGEADELANAETEKQ